MKVIKTCAYDVKDKDTGEVLTAYWAHLAGVDFWNDFSIPKESPKVRPNKLPPDYYELISDIYKVEIEYIPAKTEVRKIH